MADGLVDTNVFIHAHTNDTHTDECALEEGTQTAVLESVVVHELTYAWGRYFKEASRDDAAAYILKILLFPGIVGDIPLLTRTVRRWRDSNIAFVDCLLAERALRDNAPVYTKNVRDLRSQGVEVPDPLPD